jgi:uncharacterized protein (TIGR00288 family)
LLQIVDDPESTLSQVVPDHLRKRGEEFRELVVLKDKAVDVAMAVDLVEMTIADEFDAAYLLTADGDFTPAVESVRKRDKKVYVASTWFSSHLQRVANAFITLTPEWFSDCYR